jgi:putative glutamine amidotransferase
MPRRRPVVGLSTYNDVVSWYAWEEKAATLVAEVYLDAVSAGGGAPVLLPSALDPSDVIGRLDAVVLVGGPDVGAECYGQESRDSTHPADHRRDAFELALIRAAREADLPLLGICRGAQLMNVERGGTLSQHLPEIVGHEGHSPGHGTYGKIGVALEPGTRVAAALGTTTVEVACFHHQAVDMLGEGLSVVGRAADGTIEAIEDPNLSFALGVQWHPEEDRDVALFRALIEAAAASRG